MSDKTDNQKKVAAWVAKVTKAHGGKLTPEALVDDAKRPESEGHELFEWDVEKAAMQHWLDRARQIIRSVTVEITTNNVEVRVPFYVRDPDAATDEQGYSSVARIRSDKEKIADVLLDELRRINSSLTRAQGLAGYFGVEADFVAMVQALQTIRAIVAQKVEEKA
jgi:hypothetical protein